MTAGERRAATGLAGIFAFRMLGLFLILPVFTLYATDLEGYTPLLAGFAIGAYGLTQALLQIPFGMLSDRFGRKPIITLGLLVFALGSIVAAMADSLIWVVVGRALQGAGAVAAAIMALAADLTREEHRVKTMAAIGISIGGAFALSLILGPLLGRWVGLSGLFWTMMGLALCGIAILHLYVPTPALSRVHRDAEAVPGQILGVLRNPDLLRLDLGILVLHLVMTATFVALPLALRDYVGLAADDHWQLYLGVMLASLALMIPFIVLAERHHKMKAVFVGAVLTLGLTLAGLALIPGGLTATLILLTLFFSAFNVLEASLPSLVSRVAPAQSKGTAMGVYSSSQFFGAFLGGAAGGWTLGVYGVHGVFMVCGVLVLAWLLLALGMRTPRYLSSRLIRVGALDPAQAAPLAARLAAIPGVAEAVVVVEEGVAYLKVDRQQLDEEALRRFSTA